MKDTNEINEENKTDKQIPEQLSQAESISVLIQAAEIAQKKGIYTFEESALIYKAIKTFVQNKK